MKRQQKGLNALKAAFPYTVPILTGFLFLGMTYGILMSAKGYGGVWPLLMSGIVFAGGVQFVAIGLLTSPFNPLQAFLLSLGVNARHLFYGISLLEPLRGIGRIKPWLIFSLCDENFSMLQSVQAPPEVDRAWFSFWLTFLNYVYWVLSSFLGGLVGDWISISVKGLDFALVALYVVMFLEQWKTKRNRVPALIGGGCSVLMLLAVGRDSFIIPAMLLMLCVLLLFGKRLAAPEAEGAKGGEAA